MFMALEYEWGIIGAWFQGGEHYCLTVHKRRQA
ncbi:hypothetical protein Nhal_0435 [Nitrosococcus halophilus Nc 4]|uniref:Uncharacterized protein n=1 Tax=Nitrosococcus halophilus (strain Nc4) TaxID=472759 RepID=D5BVJ5_NITHN|nr:hypothetical protein Nhal_0435 [Nitrosococcus halophilus Nc 4]